MLLKYYFWICLAFCFFSINLAQDSLNSNDFSQTSLVNQVNQSARRKLITIKQQPLSAIVKFLKIVKNDESKSSRPKTTTEEIEYYDDETTIIIKTTEPVDENVDGEEEEEEKTQTTIQLNEEEYYDDDEPIKVVVESGSTAELECGDSTKYDEYIDWDRQNKVRKNVNLF